MNGSHPLRKLLNQRNEFWCHLTSVRHDTSCEYNPVRSFPSSFLDICNVGKELESVLFGRNDFGNSWRGLMLKGTIFPKKNQLIVLDEIASPFEHRRTR